MADPVVKCLLAKSKYRWNCIILRNVILLLLTLLCSLQATVTVKTCNGVKCINGMCKNDTDFGTSTKCVCEKGWTGSSCEYCGGRANFSASEGYITDGAGNYSLDTKCTWLIEGKSGVPIRLRFDHFATECSWDHLYIYDGNSVWDPLVAVFSGLIIPEGAVNKSIPEVTTSSGSAYIHFYSDAAYNMSGFNITYKMGVCPLDCSGHGECEIPLESQTSYVCQCDIGWKGEACNIEMCPNNCSYPQGHCDTEALTNRYCKCEATYRGPDCSIADQFGVWEEIYPTPSDNVPHARASHATIITGKNMWVVSGYDFGGTKTTFQNLVSYDLDFNKWEMVKTAPATVPKQRYGHSAALWESNIYMFGGLIENTITDELWQLNLEKFEWSPIAVDLIKLVHPGRKSPLAVVGHTAHIIDGIMYVFFGHSPEYGYMNTVQLFNIDTMDWSTAQTEGAIVKGGYGHTSVYDPEMKLVYVHAGYHSTSSSTYNLDDSLYSFNPATLKWFILRSSGQRKYLHSAVIMNGLMLVFGGNTHNDTSMSYGAKCYSTDFMAYDIACDAWYPLDSPKLQRDISRFGHSAVVYNNNMYVFGGFNGVVLNDLFVYKPGNCHSYVTSDECLGAREGIKCVFADNQKCLPPNLAEQKMTHKNIQKIEKPTCPPVIEDSEARCKEMKTCPSCTENSYGCVWCRDKCVMTGLCTDHVTSPDNDEMCRANYTLNSTACLSLHNCLACESDPQCTWDTTRDTKCSPLEATPEEKESKCEPTCHTHESCENCTTSMCMWCSNQQRCVESNSYVASFPYGQCMEWTTLQSKCPSTQCSELRTCGECQEKPSCGWCDDGSDTGLGACMQGNKDGPVTVTDDVATPQPNVCPATRWHFTECPLCQCNGHSQCHPGTDTCIACEDLTTGPQCDQCQDGYTGTPTNGGNCTACECNGQADLCDQKTGDCHCRTRGVVGNRCDQCDKDHKYFGNPKEGGTCYYNLTTDYQFTFNLSKEDNKYYTQINFMNTPSAPDRDVDFNINCSSKAYMNITVRSSIDDVERVLLSNFSCTSFKAKFSCNEYAFGPEHNTTFYVYVYDFKTPFWLQVTFAQYGLNFGPHIDLLKFFVIFFSCFLSLLLIAAILWKVKQRYDLYRRRQRLVVEMEQMASRPFASANVEINSPSESLLNKSKEPPDLRGSIQKKKETKASPIALEPLAGQKAAILSLVMRLPCGDEDYTPPGQTGMALASALVTLGNPRKTSVEHQKSEKNRSRKQNGAVPENCV